MGSAKPIWSKFEQHLSCIGAMIAPVQVNIPTVRHLRSQPTHSKLPNISRIRSRLIQKTAVYTYILTHKLLKPRTVCVQIWKASTKEIVQTRVVAVLVPLVRGRSTVL